MCVDSRETAVTVISGEANLPAPVVVRAETDDKVTLLLLEHDQAVHFAAALVEASLYHCSEELRGKFRNLARDLLKATSTPLRQKP